MKYFIIYLIIINLLTFLAMFIDKQKAKKGKWRTKELTLFIFVLLGGGIGGIAGMKLFRHKTKKALFKYGFPTILIFETVCLIFILL